MNVDLIKYLPKSYLLTLSHNEVAMNWRRLPKSLAEDSDIQKLQFCERHWLMEGDVLDGPPRIIKDCMECCKS